MITALDVANTFLSQARKDKIDISPNEIINVEKIEDVLKELY